MGKFGQDAVVTPLLYLHPYSKDILGFLLTTESQDLSLTSHPKGGMKCKYETDKVRQCLPFLRSHANKVIRVTGLGLTLMK